jgi:hypothetical protein
MLEGRSIELKNGTSKTRANQRRSSYLDAYAKKKSSFYKEHCLAISDNNPNSN